MKIPTMDFIGQNSQSLSKLIHGFVYRCKRFCSDHHTCSAFFRLYDSVLSQEDCSTANSNPVSANNLEYQPFHCILIECVFFASKFWSLNCTFPVVSACLCDDSSSCPYINSHTLRHIKINMQNPLFRDDFERKLWLVHIISLVHCTISGESPMYPHFLVRFARTLPITYIGRIARFSYKPILVLSWFSVPSSYPISHSIGEYL